MKSESPSSLDEEELIIEAITEEIIEYKTVTNRPSIVFYVVFTLLVGVIFSLAYVAGVFSDGPKEHAGRTTPRPSAAPNLRAPPHAADDNQTFIDYLNDKHMMIERVISCYYNTPSENNTNDLMPLDINPYLCTHINVAFAQVVNKEIVFDKNQEQTLKDIIKLRLKNKKLKILLSVGGAGGHSGFSDMVVDHASRKTFIRSIKSILRNYTLDGIDLDWEFPAVHSSMRATNVTPATMQALNTLRAYRHRRERQHFSQLLREIRMEFIREKKEYLLTVAVAAPKIIADASYDVDQLNEYVDYINLMTYDFHSYTKLTPFTGLNSPLYARSNEELYLSTLNINYTVNMYMDKGMLPSKIVVGIPTYGHSFYLVNPSNTDIGSPASGFGSLGSFVDYSDICKFINDNAENVTVKKDNDSKVPYLYHSHDWVSYDDPVSVMEKARYIKDNELRGAMIYSLNSDDYRGDCQVLGVDDKFPLLHSIRETL